MTRRAIAGVDIGGTKTAVTLSIDPPRTVSRAEFPTDPRRGPEHAIASIVGHLRGAVALAREQEAGVAAIGISCGGPLDSARGIIQRPPNLSTWDDVPIVDLLATEFGIPCFLQNDADAGALAEFRYGAGRGARNMVFLTMGTGLGAGLIVNGELLCGVTDAAGEIGHLRLTRSGPVGYGKAGSVEGWASGGGMAQVAGTFAQAACGAATPPCCARKACYRKSSRPATWRPRQARATVWQSGWYARWETNWARRWQFLWTC